MNYLKLISNLVRLKGNLHKSEQQILNLQKEKLYKILTYAYDNSAYYRESFNSVGIKREDILKRSIKDFPVITKEELMNNFSDVVTVKDINQREIIEFDKNSDTKDIFKNKYHIVHSSGSTGTPMYFLYDEDAWNNMVVGIIRGAIADLTLPQLFKLLAGGLRILYIAAVNGRYGGAMAVGSSIDGLHGKRLFIDVNTPLNEWENKIEEFNPSMIIGYPSALKILAEITKSQNLNIDASRVISCGEPLSPGLRSYLDQVFDAKIVNFYGASESLVMGVEFNNDSGLFLFDDLNYIEIEDESIYLTSLYNYAQPLIRYKISDKLEPMRCPSQKDFPFTRVNVLLSRQEDVMWFTRETGEKEFLHPLSIEGFCIQGLIDFQFHQTGSKSFEMWAQVSDKNLELSIKNEMKRLMGSILLEKQLSFLSFTIKFVNQILPDQQSGKKQLIVKDNDYYGEDSEEYYIKGRKYL